MKNKKVTITISKIAKSGFNLPFGMIQLDVGQSSLSRSVRSGSAARAASLSSPSKGSLMCEGIASWPVLKQIIRLCKVI